MPPALHPHLKPHAVKIRTEPLVHRDRKPGIGLLIQFAFGVDILEMYLNEVYDVVDKFFILESSHSHTYLFKKRLVWERVRDQPRFAKFADKIVYFVLDDAEGAAMEKVRNSNWAPEEFQEESQWEKFLKWNEVRKVFGEDDLLGFGATDEIPARRSIQYLKYCDLSSDPVDIGSWSILGTVNQIMATDWPVRGHIFLLGEPTFWTLKTAKNGSVRFKFSPSKKVPSRNRGKSLSFVIGGTHLSDYPYIPHCLAKRLTNSEQDLHWIAAVASYPNYRKNMSVSELEAFYASVTYNKIWRHKIFNLSAVPQMNMYLPWFYECNRQRYPALEGNYDPRLD